MQNCKISIKLMCFAFLLPFFFSCNSYRMELVQEEEIDTDSDTHGNNWGDLDSETYRELLRSRLDIDSLFENMPTFDNVIPISDEHYQDDFTIQSLVNALGFNEFIPNEQRVSEIVLGDEAGEDTPFFRYDEEKSYYFYNGRKPLGRGVITSIRYAGGASVYVNEEKDDPYLIEKILKSAERLMSLIGGKQNEYEFQLTEFMRSEMTDRVRPDEHDGNQDQTQSVLITTVKLEKVLYVYRKVNHLYVENDRMVFSFSLDGELRKVTGQWHRLDYSKIQWMPHFGNMWILIEKVIDKLVKLKINPFYYRKIEMYPIYTIVNKNGLSMHLGISVPLDDGAGSYSLAEFQINI